MKGTKVSLWANAAPSEKSPVLTGPVGLPHATARMSLWQNKAAGQNPKAPVLNGNLELSTGYVKALLAMAQAGQVDRGYQDVPVMKLPIQVSPPGGGQGLSGSIEIPLELLQGDLAAGRGLEVVNQNTGEQAFKLRVSIWRGDGQNPQAPVLRGEVESPSERAAYQASRGQAAAGNAWGAAPAAPAAPAAAPAAAAWGAPAAAPAAAPAPVAVVPAPADAPAPVQAMAAPPAPVAAAGSAWDTTPAF
jgi:hypothetical protein